MSRSTLDVLDPDAWDEEKAVTPLPETARPDADSVRCSALVGELEAALRCMVAATPPTEYEDENPARYAAMVLLNRLDSERRSSPTDQDQRPLAAKGDSQ